VKAGTRSNDLRAWKPFPVKASDEGAGRSHQPNTGHAFLEVAVENSWPCTTGGPSGRDDLSKSRRDLLAIPQSMRSRAGRAAHHCAMKRYEQLIKMAPHNNAGLIGKAQAPHIQRRGYKYPSLRSGLRPKGKCARSRYPRPGVPTFVREASRCPAGVDMLILRSPASLRSRKTVLVEPPSGSFAGSVSR
jgi:hypothetical protein